MKNNKPLLIIVILLFILNVTTISLLMTRENIFEGIIFNKGKKESSVNVSENKNDNNTNENNVENNLNNENNTENNNTEVVENNNSTESTEISTKNSNIFSIVTKNNSKIYSLMKDGSEKELMDIKEYTDVAYSYSDGKLYLLLYRFKPASIDSKTGKTKEESSKLYTIGYIDVNSSSPYFKKIINVSADGLPNSIVAENNYIYYSFSSINGVFMYDVASDQQYKLKVFEEYEAVRLFPIDNEKIAFSSEGHAGQKPVMGIFNISDRTIKTISSNASIEYTYNNKIIYTQYLSPDNFETLKYYEYDIKTESIKAISDSVLNNSSLYNSYIIPYNDYYIYAKENVLYKYVNNKSELLFEFKDSIDSMNFISDNALAISYGEGMDSDGVSAILDLSNMELYELKDLIKYSNVIYDVK